MDDGKNAGLPPPNEEPVNLEGTRYFEIESYTVASYCPKRDGKGPRTQVHLIVRVKGWPHPIVMRFKTQDACQTMISALRRHRDDVWG